MRKKKLTVGKRTFKIIREEDYLYIDKTEYIHEMLKMEESTFYQDLTDLKNIY
ncbi:MAG: AAA family ATPase [Methanobrevibacter sp.]|jgi:hypothetical protein|nr:AAA family ATPase [Candidatus Methanovirga aequatorialis]